MKIYVIGSLRNDKITAIANALEAAGHEVFADWFAPGPKADEFWQEYEQARGRSFFEAIEGPHAKNVCDYDTEWLDWADAAVMVMPAGKSAHLEFGRTIGQNKKGFILFDGEPERWDVMYRFATGIFQNLDALVEGLNA